MNLNKLIIVGRVTQEVELRTTQNGTQVATVNMATNRYSKGQDGQRQDQAEYHTVVLWQKLAELAGQYVSKGQLLLIEGRLQTRSWEGKDGIKRYKTEIVAEQMQFGPRSGESSSPSTPSRSNYQSPSAPPKGEEDVDPSESSKEEEISVDDIPF